MVREIIFMQDILRLVYFQLADLRVHLQFLVFAYFSHLRTYLQYIALFVGARVLIGPLLACSWCRGFAAAEGCNTIWNIEVNSVNRS